MTGALGRRLVATVALAAYWAGLAFGGQLDVDPPWLLDDVWSSSAPWIVGIVANLAVAASVGRWWVLLVAAAPVAVYGGLELAGHVAPWHDSRPPFTQLWETGGWWLLFWTLLFPLGLGVLVRTRGLAPARTDPARRR